MAKNLIIILDPAHGEETPGKRSPDGKHREYKWSRYICDELKIKLEHEGYMVTQTTFTENEPGLTKRQTFAKNYDGQGKTKFLLSLHNNAAGNGESWYSARGFENYAFSTTGKSAEFGKVIMEQLIQDFPSMTARKGPAPNLVKSANFTVLAGSGYYANLLEWLFQDNQEDVKLLEDYSTNFKLVESLVKAINKINDSL